MKKSRSRIRSRNGSASDRRAMARLYKEDEVAWLDRTAALARREDWQAIDSSSLAEYLEDMARRDRREVKNRLVTLLAHLLKWQFQPGQRTRSWAATILHQRNELEGAVDISTLHNHAVEVLPDAYQRGVKIAIKETGLKRSEFPEHCPYSLEFILGDEFPGGDVAE